MDPVANPFRPGAGRRPPVLAGREPILDAFMVVRRKVDELGEGDRGWILNGLRGVGKTVLLNELLAQVSAKGWIAAKVEVTPAIPLPVALSSALVRAMRAATGRHPEPRLRRPARQTSLRSTPRCTRSVSPTCRFRSSSLAPDCLHCQLSWPMPPVMPSGCMTIG